jgi:hypothetical protein
VGSVRRELLDHVIPLNERHLLRLGQEYISYYEYASQCLPSGSSVAVCPRRPAVISPVGANVPVTGSYNSAGRQQ